MAFKLRDISIKNKLVLMQVFTCVLVLSIFFAVFVVTDVRSYKLRKAKNMIGLAQVTGTNNISTLRFDDNDAANEILTELHNVAPEILAAAIVNRKGNFFAGYGQTAGDSSWWLRMPASVDSLFTDRELLVSNKITDKNEYLGKIIFRVDLSELEEIKRSTYQLATILLFVALGISFLIANLIQTYISRRLLRFVDAIKEVSRTGDYSKTIADNGKDEIGTLIEVFNRLIQQVKQNQEKKDEFIGIASHELKTPLTSIKGYIELLNAIEDKQPNKQFVQKSLDNVHKLERLIKDLLDVSNIQSGQLKLNTSSFDIDQLIDETISAFQIVSAAHHTTRSGSFQHEMIVADRQRIEQVLINLLSNAIKYSPGENDVIVYSTRTDTELIIGVRDFGIGVTASEMSNIFERFYRSEDASKNISGFGLGLYICRDIINRHHGKIWVEREEKGASFYFSLPINKLL